MVELSELSYYRYCRITFCYLIGRRSGHQNMVELRWPNFCVRQHKVWTAKSKTGVSFGICPSFIHDDLGIKQQYCKFVPRVLTLGQKETRKEFCENLLKLALQDQICQHKVITGDETCAYGYYLKTILQSSQWLADDKLRPKRARMEKSEMKVLFVTFSDSTRLLYHEFIPWETPINQQSLIRHNLDYRL
ncbi:hypothetical protein LAZ67_7000934 [Cordylochernes scorpioides]|uniref:Uncharacterized protein n=1 Tax=Cordylochernes scorpioides TaxID=51811 RepID=A0ABY6KRV9_9ARAC|nr:hypothetical protein LAZ67_7000934 [Cordylochernes scorpioides]